MNPMEEARTAAASSHFGSRRARESAVMAARLAPGASRWPSESDMSRRCAMPQASRPLPGTGLRAKPAAPAPGPYRDLRLRLAASGGRLRLKASAISIQGTSSPT